MRRKDILNLEPMPPKKREDCLTSQILDNVLILGYWKDRKLEALYALNVDTDEHEGYFPELNKWRKTGLMTVLGREPMYTSMYWKKDKVKWATPEDRKRAENMLFPQGKPEHSHALTEISGRELKYNRDRKEQAEDRRVQRMDKLMGKVPVLPDDFESWIHQIAAGSRDFSFWDKETKKWSCTACGRKTPEGKLKRVDGGNKIRHNDMVVCPWCKKTIQVKKRTDKMEKRTRCMVLQDIDADMSVSRLFDIRIWWQGEKREIEISEAARVFLLRNDKKYRCRIYYGQRSRDYCKDEWDQYFDKRNPSSRKTLAEEFLYPKGIEKALKGTEYEEWTRLFQLLANKGQKMKYNQMMFLSSTGDYIRTMEYLLKGRFYRLVQEMSEYVSAWTAEYYGPINIHGADIEEVFDIQDRQKINRIRDMDGGMNTLDWLRWSDEMEKKINDETLRWLSKENVTRRDLNRATKHMSLQQIMNYVKKQKALGYPRMTAAGVLSQYEDYLSMCEREKKDLDDEMVYRPRDLKLRHQELVEEIRKRQMIERMKRDEKQTAEEARKMREKFPGAEEILQEIKPKYEYQDEQYRILVPKTLAEIVLEGNALHHCAGATDRYFERIRNRETYICFLRRCAEPGTPYYTIEVEPGGTIRQHRGYLDEEPGIEEIRPFLRKWQQEIKKRLNAQDREYAKTSAVKRLENIEELKAKNNLRVLKGLEEDFMEAM